MTNETRDPTPQVHVLDEILAQHREETAVRLGPAAATAAGAAAVTSALPASAGTAADDPPPDKLSDLLKISTQVPSSTVIAVVPTQATSTDIQILSDIQLLNSYMSVASMRYLYKLHPGPWNISDTAQAAAFTRASLDAKLRILTGGLGSFLTQQASTVRSFSRSTTTADLHVEFLSTLFGGFGFPAATLKQLDGILTSVTQTLKNLKLSLVKDNATVDHLVFVYYLEPAPGFDAKVPKMRLFYLHIDQRSWTAAVGKSSVSHFNFNMSFDDNVFEMNAGQVENNRAQIQDLIAQLTQQSFDSISNLLSPETVKGDVTKA